MKYGLLLVVALLCLTSGCLPTGSTVAGSALVHSHFPYAVSYQDEKAKSVLGEDWDIENYRVARKQADGTPVLERKDGYESTYEFDFDDDDKGDAKQRLPNPDVVLVHRKTNARLEVATLLLDKKRANKELRVLLNDIVENASGTRSLYVGFGNVAAGVQKRYASRLLDSAEASLGDQKGLVATIERADLDQLQLNPKARWRRSRLFMMHMPFDYYVSEGVQLSGSEVATKPPHKYRVLLLVEYTNTPEDFEAQYPDFVRLMNEVHVLSDDMLLEYLASDLSKCGDKARPATLSVTVSPVGNGSLKDAKELDRICSSGVVATYRFAGTGEGRDISRDYDFSKELKPAWLTAGGYSEQRTAPAAADAPKPDEKPAADEKAPAPAAETPPAQGGASAPVDPKAAPSAGGTAAPSEEPKPKP